MSRERSPKRSEALKIWLKSDRKKKPKEIAKELDISASLVRKWKSIDRWDEIPDGPSKRGAPYRNRNAVGNKGGAPHGNQNAVTHGMYSRKYLPDDEELMALYDSFEEMKMLEVLYEEIRIAFVNFVRAQKIMYVKDIDDETRTLKKRKQMNDAVKIGKGDDQRVETYESYNEEEWETQHAWDKMGRSLTAQAAAGRALSNKIKQYEELIRSVPEEDVQIMHKLRIDKMKADIKAVEAKEW